MLTCSQGGPCRSNLMLRLIRGKGNRLKCVFLVRDPPSRPSSTTGAVSSGRSSGLLDDSLNKRIQRTNRGGKQQNEMYKRAVLQPLSGSSPSFASNFKSTPVSLQSFVSFSISTLHNGFFQIESLCSLPTFADCCLSYPPNLSRTPNRPINGGRSRDRFQ